MLNDVVKLVFMQIILRCKLFSKLKSEVHLFFTNVSMFSITWTIIPSPLSARVVEIKAVFKLSFMVVWFPGIEIHVHDQSETNKLILP